MKTAEDGPRTAVIFLHIPKTAGTTLHNILDRQYPPQSIHSFGADAHASVDQFKALDAAERGQIRLLRGHMAYGLHEYLPDGAKYFTLLREPIARVISTYNFIHRTPDHYLYEHVVGQKMSLRDLMESEMPLMLNDGQVRLISGVWGDPGFGKVTADMLAQARQHLRRSFIVTGLTEQFDASLQLLKERLNWTHDITYRRLNVTSQGLNEKQLPPATLDAIRHANQHDLALYAAARELFKEQCSRQDAFFNLRVRRLKARNRAAQRRAKP